MSEPADPLDYFRGRGLGALVAERVLYLDGEANVRVRIGTPITDERDQTMSGCPCQIEGIGTGKVRFIYGVDEMQALWLALQTIGADLYASAEYQSGRLRLFAESGPHDDLGFPVPENVKDLLPQRNGNGSSSPVNH